jgi:hypothetical protein
VLFLLFGSSASGKTVAIDALRGRVRGVAVHDFDEIGVPSGANTAWRHRADEEWVRRALEYQARGLDVLLAGQTPLGELLATPSAPLLDAISACLLDCDDETRIARLLPRGPGWLARSAGELEHYLSWAAWMRGHATDPAWRPDVIRHDETDQQMHWGRWESWAAGDPRWRVLRLDTTQRSPEEVADALAAWIEAERELARAGAHPLTDWADSAGRL